MRILSSCTALLLAMAPLAAHAQEAATASTVKTGAFLWSADAKRIGRVERVIPTRDGAPGWASVIVDSRFVSVPVTTISASDKGLVTSLSKADVRKLK
ncbi:hypothetical protein [Sphingomonas profundi]|uniref:hypothetical protein n=1 Tax=Alterirhizorhabdus profundi TaxID=2681549 RepID=UPI0012E89A3D|nr:hypothetical protein [Sphingomonas profundi]